jgi:hypothetical protein
MNKKKANAAKNKARKKELYMLLTKASRDKGHSCTYTGRNRFSIGPYDGWRDHMSEERHIVIDGNIIGVMYNSLRGTYHWTGAIPTDAQMTKLRLYA